MAKKNSVSVYALLDRSGSMGGAKWESAIGSINTYVATLKNAGTKATITVAAFDSQYTTTHNDALGGNAQFAYRARTTELSFDILRSEVDITEFNDISFAELSPRGGTPLYDATARLMNLAEANNNPKTVLLIMTDGAENESKIYNKTSIKDRVASCTSRGFEVIFLGQDFDVAETATTLGLDSTKFRSFGTADMDKGMMMYASATTAYASGSAIDLSKN